VVKYVLGTGAMLALLKGQPLVVTRLDIAGKGAVSVPQPVWAELEYAIERFVASPRKETLRERLKLLRDELGRANWTDEVSQRFGIIKAELGRRCISMSDQEIAMVAHAVVARAVLVTRDVERLTCIEGLEVEDWGAIDGLTGR
jgi:tRNA(fMet)-specific endonuclease VapC